MLYRFTTFFSYMFNIIKFCGKLVTGTTYLVSFLWKPSGYDMIPGDTDRTNKKGSFLKRSKDYLLSFFRTSERRSQDVIIPLYETQSSSYFHESQPFVNHNNSSTLQQEEINLFRKHFDNLCAQEDDDESDPRPFKSVNLGSSSTNDATMFNPYL